MNFISKLSVFLCIVLSSQASLGQYVTHKKKRSFLGLTGGINYTIPTVVDRYAVLSSSEGASQKEYAEFTKNRGVQLGLRYSYGFTDLITQ